MVRMNSMVMARFFKMAISGLLTLFAASLSISAAAKDTVIEASIDSKILKQQRPIVISLPDGYEQSKQNYPVMYLLDGSSHINHTTSSSQYLAGIGAAPGIIVVGINNVERAYDLTPIKDEEAGFKTGGGDAFLDFIERELMPHIDKNYRTAGFNMFTGHSLGGLMSVYALISRPNLFDAHFAFSPSLWLKQDEMMALATKAFKKQPASKSYLYINLGNEQGGMIPAFDAFEKILTEHAPKSLRYKLERYPNETHMTIPLLGQVSGFRDLFAKWQMSREMFDLGAKEVVTFYQELSESFGYDIMPDENGVNDMGYYHLMNKKDAEKAVALFELNVKNYPDSADGYEQQGKLNKALSMVSKAIALAEEGASNYQAYIEHKAKIKALMAKG